MATVFFTSNASTRAQVTSLQITGTVASADTFTVTIGTQSVVLPSGNTTPTAAATALAASLAASDLGSFSEQNYEFVAPDQIVCTSRLPGRPFAISAFTTTGSALCTQTTTVTNSGPSDLSLAANYSTNALPANGDTLVFDGTTAPVLYNLDALSSISFDAIIFTRGFRGGSIGLPRIATGNNGREYIQYRPRYLTVSSVSHCQVNETGNGSGVSELFLSVASGTGRITTGDCTTHLLVDSPTFEVTCRSGNLLIAEEPGFVSELTALLLESGTATIGEGCVFSGSMNVIDMASGLLRLQNGGASKVTQRGGEIRQIGTCSINDLFQISGEFIWLSGGTISHWEPSDGANMRIRNLGSRTITDTKMSGNVLFSDSFGAVTFTNPITSTDGFLNKRFELANGKTLSIL